VVADASNDFVLLCYTVS